MGLLGGALLSGGLGLGKAIFGGIQAARANKQMNRLLARRPQYDISQGYLDAYKTYQRLAGSQMPGYGLMQEQIDQSTAKTLNAAERGAMSSNQFIGAAMQSQEKELDALRNLGVMSQQWQAQQQQNFAQAQNQMGQLQDQQWYTNKLEPWNVKANMASENRQAGIQNLFGGLGDMAGTIMNYAGTKDYIKMYEKLYGQNKV
jgi:hypothetical protein